RLEPYAGKLACTVLRGRRRSNVSLLPDFSTSDDRMRIGCASSAQRAQARKNPAGSRVLKVAAGPLQPDGSRYRRHLCLAAVDKVSTMVFVHHPPVVHESGRRVGRDGPRLARPYQCRRELLIGT
ncbi:hypothetical protein, partial [Paraburkholderia humisilvae]|uniref:hypothetical protein n=1 Tax=Paraburkholderia humisilvae TaxID=627669 RepID=UPI0035EFFD00